MSAEQKIYEGAGILPTYRGNFVVSARVKKADDADSVPEVEHFGGKPEGNELPHETALAEFIEEAGGLVLEDGWLERAVSLDTFQPFSKKWIGCYLLELTDDEFARLYELDKAHDSWPVGEERSFEHLTGRPGLARKAIDGIALVPAADMCAYIKGFTNFHVEGLNRMKCAKEYGKDPNRLFTAARIADPKQTWRRRLRAFNLLIFEEHIDKINEHLETHEYGITMSLREAMNLWMRGQYSNIPVEGLW